MVGKQVHCSLCGLSTLHPLTNSAGDLFCCPACLEVSVLLAESAPTPTAVATPISNSETATTAVALSGLWCPSCAWLINERLTRTSGIAAAEVSFMRREALVTYDARQTNPRAITRRIKQFGYGARLQDDKPYNEEQALGDRLLVSGVLVMHIMILSFMLYIREWTGHASPDTEWLADIFRLMITVISIPAILILGLPILRAGAASLIRGRPNIHTLIAIGAFAAFGLSVRNMIVGQAAVYFDTAAVLLFLVAIGHWLELRAQQVSGEAIDRLWQQLPAQATWFTSEGWQTTALADVPVGARVRVRPGERFPVDGLIANGVGDVDESVVTGEPDPVVRGGGDQVLAGTVNLDGGFEVIATAVATDTIIGQIGRLLHQALWQRAPAEQMADKLAARLVPLAIILSLCTFAFWTWQDGLEVGLINALSVLLIACPCALGIATPLTLWIGLGRATEAGVIVRYTGVLERLATIKQLYFDKTGTLTKRPIRLQDIATDGLNKADFLAQIAAIEALSEHPIGQAIVNATAENLHNSSLRQAQDKQFTIHNFRALPGQGVTAVLDACVVWVGNLQLMETHRLAMAADLNEAIAAWQKAGLTVVYAGWNGRIQGALGLGEEVREETAVAITQLQALDIKVAVLTGDDESAGRRWQDKLNIPVYAAQTPADKVTHLENALGDVVMVGDGINDGPALAAAAVGIAVRRGTDVAQSAADVILLHEDLRTTPWLIELSRAAMGKVRQNLIWAVSYNAIGLILAVTGLLQPAVAALLMVLSNLIVTTNALRLRHMEIGSWTAPGADDFHTTASDLIDSNKNSSEIQWIHSA